MADEDEVLPDEGTSDDGAQGEGAEGQDTGDGNEDGEISAVSPDAPSEGDDGPQDGQPEGDRPQLSRSARRVQSALSERDALREEVAAMRREREADRQARQAQEQQWTQQQWQERWAVMTPEEKIEHIASQGQQQLQNLQSQMGQQVQWMRDQMTFDAKASVNPVYARHKDEVERVHGEYALRGNFVPRQLILENLLGKKALETSSKSTSQARRAGQKKIEAQTTRPSSNKGDASSQRGKAGDSAEKRLAGVEI